MDKNNSNNVNAYIGKAVELYKVLEQETDLNKKFGYFNIAFPSVKDKVICKAIFDMKYNGTKQWHFLNSMMKEISEVTEVYNSVATYMLNKKKKTEKAIADQGGEHNTQKFKQGTTIEMNGRKDNFSQESVTNAQTTFENSKKSHAKEQNEIKRKTKNIISIIDKADIEKERINMASDLDKKNKLQQDKEQQKREEELRKKYEENLKERTKTAQTLARASDIEKIFNEMR